MVKVRAMGRELVIEYEKYALKLGMSKVDEQRTFAEYFQSLDKVKRMTNAELIRNSDLEKSYFYQIMKGNRVPSRDKAIRLCLGAGLNLAEASQALILNENASLYMGKKRDRILSFALEKGLSVTETNLLLDEEGESPLL